MRSCTLLNQSGDTTIAWDEDADQMMEEIIAKKMKEGVTFFIIEPRLGGLLPPSRKKLKSVFNLGDKRAVSVADEDFLKVLENGNADAIKTPVGEIKAKRKANTAKEASQSSTIATRPLKGG